MRTFLLILLIQLAFSVNAQKTLTGKVLDADNSEPLIGANLYLLTDFSIGAVTNFDGEFAVTIPIEHLQDSILVSYMGYSEQIIAIDQIDAVIYMDPSEMQMAAVQVVAEPLISEEFKFTKVNKLEIYTNPAAKADPLLAVNSMPAATTTDESASISL
ncbi:MAG: carboxypeptidase-like regulatory domain-containing protein, partial [Marinoscillum sp.]